MKTLDKQIDGNHYKEMGIQPWEIIAKNKLDYFEGAALKYLLRWRQKDGVIDLDKIIHYIEHIKELALSGHYGEQFKLNKQDINFVSPVTNWKDALKTRKEEYAKYLGQVLQEHKQRWEPTLQNINDVLDEELTRVLKAEEAQQRHLRSKLFKAPSKANNKPSRTRSNKRHSKPLPKVKKV